MWPARLGSVRASLAALSSVAFEHRGLEVRGGERRSFVWEFMNPAALSSGAVKLAPLSV